MILNPKATLDWKLFIFWLEEEDSGQEVGVGDNYIFLIWHLICWTCCPAYLCHYQLSPPRQPQPALAVISPKLTDQSRKFSFHPGWGSLGVTWNTADQRWQKIFNEIRWKYFIH